MSFQDSCQLIRIEVREEGTVLLAAASNGEEDVPAEILLDEKIGNVDGFFVRGDGNFSETAKDIKLDFRDDGVWLTAILSEVDGEDSEPQGINLSEHIENQEGELVWIEKDE